MSAIDWAEETLRLTATLEESKVEHDVLDDLASHLDNASDTKRTLADKIEERKTELLIEARGKHPEESQAWMDRHMRMVMHNDPEMIAYKKDHQAASSILSGLEYDWKVQERKLSLIEARMIRDGGYLNFLAAAKFGEIATAVAKIAPQIVSATAQTLKAMKTLQETQGD